jgi:hypothetical protein
VSRPEDRAEYLIPVDLTDTDSSDFWFDAVRLDDLFGELDQRVTNVLPETLPVDQAHRVSASAVARDQSGKLVQGAPKGSD